MGKEYLLQVQNVTKRYRDKLALNDFSIDIRSGEIVALIGENGAGKTTLLNIICGYIKPSVGLVQYKGENIFEKPLTIQEFGILIEPQFLDYISAEENLRLLSQLANRKQDIRIKELLEKTELYSSRKKKVKEFSFGMKQRLAIALAVMHDPELLILDEPINGLDPIGIAEVRSFIRELCDARGKTILISSHILSEISLLADDVGIIDHGKLLEEESLKELEAKNAKFIHFCVSDAQKAAQIIAATFQSRNTQLADANNLYLYDTALPVAKINRAFIEAGIDVQEAHLCEDTLEDYFKKITGGEGIA